jgi:NADH-quinone oxidoreductase subunit M
VIIAALYLLWAYQRVFHGPAEGENADMADLTWSEGAVIVPFIVAIFFIGLYPKPVLERMEPAVDALIAHVEANVDDFEEPDAEVLPSVSLDHLNGGESDGDGSGYEEDQ